MNIVQKSGTEHESQLCEWLDSNSNGVQIPVLAVGRVVFLPDEELFVHLLG